MQRLANRPKRTGAKGFTLIELIVVIAIVGVLAAILVPAMMGYVKKAKQTRANETARTIYRTLYEQSMNLELADDPSFVYFANMKLPVCDMAGWLATIEGSMTKSQSEAIATGRDGYLSFVYDGQGYPAAVAWSTGDDPEQAIVGCYPDPADVAALNWTDWTGTHLTP